VPILTYEQLGVFVGLVSTSVQSLGLTLQRKSHILEDEKEIQDVRRPPYRRRRWQLGMLMFIVSNLVGSTIQITTLPLPVLSTLQAVCSLSRLILCKTNKCIVRACLQFNLRNAYTWRGFYTLLSCWNHSCLHRRNTDSHIRSHTGASTQPRPTSSPPRPAPVHTMDGRAGCPCGCNHHSGKTRQGLESPYKQQPSNAPHSRHDVWGTERNTLSTLTPCGKVCSRATRPYTRRPHQSIQQMAVVDDTSRACHSGSHTTVLPTSRAQALLDEHIIPICLLHLQHHSHFRRFDLLQADIAPVPSRCSSGKL
jgi:hypothetical protein